MAIDFPDSPSIGDQFTVDSKTWKWDGSAWRLVGGGVSLGIDDLTDVTITSADDGELLEFDGTNWVNAVRPSSEPIGHEDKSESVISFNESTRVFSIAPAMPLSTSFTVWCAGKRHIKTTTENLTIPDVSGLYYIYFDTLGVLSYRTDYFVWDTDTPTAYIYWNAVDGKAYFFADERHGITLDWATHEYLHRTRGAAIANGFGANNYIIDGDGSLDSHAQIDIASGTFFDEDLQVDITHSDTPASNTWEQILEGNAEIPVFYRSNTHWVKDAATTFPLKAVSGVPQYNLDTAGTWSSANLANNEFGIYWIIATNNLNEPIISIMGQNTYSTKGAAEAGFYEELDLGAFPAVEFRPLYKLVYEYKNGYTNSVKARLVGVYDLRTIISAGGGVSSTPVSDHGSMTGLADDDHPQYLNETRHNSLDHSTAMDSVVLDDISNVSASTPNTGDFLKYDGAEWVPDAIPTINSLDDVGDVAITSPSSGESLTYDGTNWINSPGMPSGSITQFAGASAPTGWLSCDGTTVSRTTYAALFSVIGTTYGSGDGSTTFALPNMKGRIPVGYDSTQAEFDGLGETGGAKTHTLTTAEMPSHTHTQNSHNHTQNGHNHTQNSHGHTGTAQSAGSHAHNLTTNAFGTTSTSHTHQGTATYARGVTGGVSAAISHNTSDAGAHGHTLTVDGNTATNNPATATNNPVTATNQNTGGGAAHNNLQPYIVLNYIIKA